MSRFRLTGAESIGTAVLLACIALPLIVRMCGYPSAPAPDEAARAASDSVAQARIDSMQQRDDSIRTARAKSRAAHARKAEPYRPSRNRLDEIVN